MLFLPFRTPFSPSPSLLFPSKPPSCPRIFVRLATTFDVFVSLTHCPLDYDERRRHSPKRPPFTAMSTSLRRSIVRAGRAECAGEVESWVLPFILFFLSRRWSRDQSEDDVVIDEYTSTRIVRRGRSIASFSTTHTRHVNTGSHRTEDNVHWRCVSAVTNIGGTSAHIMYIFSTCVVRE
jgi:hypothetical protein